MRTAVRNGKRSGLVALLALVLGGCATYGGGGGDQFDLSQYDKVMVDPVVVTFAPDGIPAETGSRLPASEEKMERIRREVAQLFQSAFEQELARGGEVELVDAAGPGVLRITPELVNLRLNSPLAHSTGPIETYIRSIGEVTMNTVFRDGATGKEQLTLVDTVHGRDMGLMRSVTPVYTRIELTRIFRDWAQVIREDILRER